MLGVARSINIVKDDDEGMAVELKMTGCIRGSHGRSRALQGVDLAQGGTYSGKGAHVSPQTPEI